MAFDGWRGAFDYWTRYDSRDIFPAGWCARSRHPVQPPGSRQSKIDAANKRRTNKPSNTFIPDLVALPAAPNPAPVTIHFHSGCRTGPFVNGSRMHATTTAPNHKTLAKLCLHEMLASSGDASQLARRLFDVAGESCVVAVAGKNFIVKIPQKGVGAAEMGKFLASVCEACDACPNLITLAAGPDQCDKCIKQDRSTPDDKRPAEVTASNDGAPAADAVPERQTGRETTNGSAQPKNVALPKRRSDADAKQKSVQPAQSSKRRRSSDADTESSTSMSSTASSASEHFAKVPKKDAENSVSVNTETKTLQTQTITTTSISSESRRVCGGHACRDIASHLRLPSISVTNSRPSTIAKEEKTPPPPPPPAPPTSSRSQMPRGPVTDWSIEDVIQFIAYTDASLGAHATIFREHVSVGFHALRIAKPQ